jgi:uncharacterized membrane protein
MVPNGWKPSPLIAVWNAAAMLLLGNGLLIRYAPERALFSESTRIAKVPLITLGAIMLGCGLAMIVVRLVRAIRQGYFFHKE